VREDTDPAAREQALAARDRAVARICGSVVAALVAVTLAYASTRYVVFGPWDVGDIPLYVLNKSLAWSSLALIGLAFLLGPLARLAPRRFGPLLWQRKYYGLAGFGLASAHVMLSLAIFNYRYYRLFFDQVFELTDLATATMSAGVLAWLALLLPAALSFPSVQHGMSRLWWRRAQVAGLVALALGGVHVLYGAPGWLLPAQWHGGMPPITLINAIGVAGVFAVRILARLARRPAPPAVGIR
jgi:DMSO/TMAO reductase YedYZ heme-binding membrane subunit